MPVTSSYCIELSIFVLATKVKIICYVSIFYFVQNLFEIVSVTFFEVWNMRKFSCR